MPWLIYINHLCVNRSEVTHFSVKEFCQWKCSKCINKGLLASYSQWRHLLCMVSFIQHQLDSASGCPANVCQPISHSHLSDSWQVHICHLAKIPPPPELFLCSFTPSPLHYHYPWQWIIVQLTFFSANARCYWQPQHETRPTFTWFHATVPPQIGLHHINRVIEPLHHGQPKTSFRYVHFCIHCSCRIHIDMLYRKCGSHSHS